MDVIDSVASVPAEHLAVFLRCLPGSRPLDDEHGDAEAQRGGDSPESPAAVTDADPGTPGGDTEENNS